MRGRCGRSLLAVAIAAVAAALVPGTTRAAQLIARNATGVHLSIDGQGVALITYSAKGQVNHVLARGAINALPRSKSRPQVSFQLDYAGGQKFFGKPVWEGFDGKCGRYTGPKLYGMVVACTAPDGSYWALQSWQKALPDLGFTPWTSEQRTWWLELSHWTGPVAQLDVWQGWAQKHDNAVFGTYTYEGSPVYGFGTTSTGIPTDSYGRLVYLDTFNSAYGRGWIRENSFVSRGPVGQFCYALIARNPRVGGYEIPPGLPQGERRGPGVGQRYRIVAEGPGVTPVVSWQGGALHPFDAADLGDAVVDVLNRERLAALAAKNSCLSGQLFFKGIQSALELQDTFQGQLSSLWSAPRIKEGASVSTTAGALTFSFPAGQSSSATLMTKGELRDPDHTPVFVDLGAAGVPASAEFDLLIASPESVATDGATCPPGNVDFGIRIRQGRLDVVGRTSSAPSNSTSPIYPLCTAAVRETAASSLSYDSRAMRWLAIWLAGTAVEAWYAPTAEGPWTRAGSVATIAKRGATSSWPNYYLSYPSDQRTVPFAGKYLVLRGSGGGDSAVTFSVQSLNG